MFGLFNFNLSEVPTLFPTGNAKKVSSEDATAAMMLISSRN
jgi:hypothetical protein